MARRITERRARVVESLSGAWWHLTQENGLADKLTLSLLEHAIRDSLSDTDCPACCEAELAKALDKAVDSAAP